MSQLGVYLLGPPRIELDEKPIHIGRRKVTALLAYLAVTRKRQSRETLAAFLAPQFDRAGARADLRRTLSLLNRLLGERWLAADRETVGLNPERDLWLDVEAFRQRLAQCGGHAHPLVETCVDCLPLLEEAVALYQGDFLAGFTLPGSLVFDDWQRFESEALRRELASALERLVRGLSSQGMYEDAIPHSRRWLELNLTHEPAHRSLMELYTRTGQTSAALSQYEYCVETLAEELGVPPAAETRRPAERIRAGDVGVSEPAMRPDVMGPLETPAVPLHNLPPQPTPFIGRETELLDLDALFADPEVRLITVVGPGGAGKTRLALEAAEQQLGARSDAGEHADHRFPHGVFFVDLAALSVAEHVIPAFAEALNFQLQGGVQDRRTPERQILDYLRQKRMLLIVDNFEHLLDGAELLAAVVQTASNIQVLATSRERLRLHEEQVYAIGGLEFADWKTPQDADRYSAARLFSQSAQRVKHDFVLHGDDLTYLSQICRLVDGMPLTLELAASWADTLSLADIAAEIQRGFDFLETEWRDVPQRHHSMRAVFDASWQQLTPAEREMFAQLSVFRAGFTRAAAQKVVRTETPVPASLRTLARLVSKSLVQYDRPRDRYDLHELLRQFGAHILAQDPASEAQARDRHSVFFCENLRRWEKDLQGARQVAALDEIEVDLENVRVAWEWAAAQCHVARLDQSLGAFAQFYWRRVRHHDGIAACQLAVDALTAMDAGLYPDAMRVAAHAMLIQAHFHLRWGEKALAKSLLERSQELLKCPALASHDTRRERALLFLRMGETAIPHWEEAQRLFEQSLSLFRSLDDRVHEAWNLLFLGNVYGAGGDLGGAKQLYEESLAIHRALRNHAGIGTLLRSLGLVAAQLGDRAEVQRLVGESLTLFQAQDRQLYAGFLLAELGLVQREVGDYEAAGQRFKESLTVSRFLGSSSIESFVLLLMGCLAMDDYDCNEAELKFSEAMTLSQAHGYQAGIASSLASLGHLAIFQGRFKAAADYVRESVALYREIGDTRAVAYALADLGAAFWFLGELAQADVTIKTALTTAEEMVLDRVWMVITQRQAQGDVYTGRYTRARVQAGATLNLAREAGYRTPYGMLAGWPDGFRIFRRTNTTGRTHCVLGWAALAKEQYGQAKQAFQDSLSAFQAMRNREDEAWSLAGLGHPAHGLGKQANAQGHLLEALEIVVEIRAFVSLLHVTPIISVLLADDHAQSQKERAVELYALARTQPLVSKAPLFEDVAGKHIAAATADLPPNVVAEAHERGRVMDWWETAERLLVELRQMGWGNESDH